MGYTPTSYAFRVVIRGKRELVYDPTAPFGDPSLIRGGVDMLEHLVDMCESGQIHFIEATPERIALARRNPLAVFPGLPVDPRTFQQWGRLPRNDLGRARARPVTNPQGLPLTRRLVGAITPKLVLDELDDQEVIESDVRSEDEVVEELESDPIEDWSDEEREADDAESVISVEV